MPINIRSEAKTAIRTAEHERQLNVQYEINVLLGVHLSSTLKAVTPKKSAKG